MENKNEYICIISATVLHGLVTYFKLGSMPHISFLCFDEVSVIAMGLWAFYGAVLYIAVHKWTTKCNISEINWVKMIVFAICMPVLKGVIDIGIARLTQKMQSVMEIAVADGVTNFLFGAILMYLAHCVVIGKWVNCVFQKAKLELGITIGVLALYAIIVGCLFWQNQQAIDYFGATAEEIRNLDYHFAYRIVDGNVYCYVLFYIFFWKLLRSATQDVTEEQIGLNKEQIDESK